MTTPLNLSGGEKQSATINPTTHPTLTELAAELSTLPSNSRTTPEDLNQIVDKINTVISETGDINDFSEAINDGIQTIQ